MALGVGNKSMRRRLPVLAVVFSFAILGALFGVSRISIGAMPEPGKTESYLATGAKHILVRMSSRHVIPPATLDMQASTAEGEKLYGVDCAACHGMDGSKPTDAGRWMYPRVPKLTSAEVQQYSDAELFWIAKNGIRLSGMPAFGKVEIDENIWNLVHYIRSLHETREQTKGDSPSPE
jgi:mono/diheme cytochrome c family protein